MPIEIDHPPRPIDTPPSDGVPAPGGKSLDAEVGGSTALPTVDKGYPGFPSPHVDAISDAEATFQTEHGKLGPLASLAHGRHQSWNGIQAYTIDSQGKAHPQALGGGHAANVDQMTENLAKVDKIIGAIGVGAKTVATFVKPNPPQR